MDRAAGSSKGLVQRGRGGSGWRRFGRIERRHKAAAGGSNRIAAGRRRATGRLSATPNCFQPTGAENLPGVVFSFGATRVGVLLERMRLHLGTQRFLAARRGDRIWEASCDYAALSLERLGARLRPEAFAAELFPELPAMPRAEAGSRLPRFSERRPPAKGMRRAQGARCGR